MAEHAACFGRVRVDESNLIAGENSADGGIMTGIFDQLIGVIHHSAIGPKRAERDLAIADYLGHIVYRVEPNAVARAKENGGGVTIDTLGFRRLIRQK
jgi:hypothetical protein